MSRCLTHLPLLVLLGVGGRVGVQAAPATLSSSSSVRRILNHEQPPSPPPPTPPCGTGQQQYAYYAPPPPYGQNTAYASCVDDDTCLQSKPSWGSSYYCSSSTQYCTGSWEDDMADCCPYSCGQCRRRRVSSSGGADPCATQAPSPPFGALSYVPVLSGPTCEASGYSSIKTVRTHARTHEGLSRDLSGQCPYLRRRARRASPPAWAGD